MKLFCLTRIKTGTLGSSYNEVFPNKEKDGKGQ